MEAALKAEHCVEPEREIQFCAKPLVTNAAEAAMTELFRMSRIKIVKLVRAVFLR